MRIGIDFDNTIICYDRVFNRVGVEKGLIPETLPNGKTHVRDHLRNIGREDDWTWLQGYVYGTRLNQASLYKGVKPFLRYCLSKKIGCFIISHKTRHPFVGEPYDLHQAARDFIRSHEIELDVFFEPTKQDKIKRINRLGCDCFIDDLPEFLGLPGFSDKIDKILFDPLKTHKKNITQFKKAHTWEQILKIIKDKDEVQN